jgi:5'-nucleotidase
MKLLLTNGHEIAVVAPEGERSAISHAVSLRKPLRPVRRPGPGLAWSLDGTPADCVKLAVHVLLPWRPDFVVSGINRGLNVGVDVLYSGTAAGALEGVVQGIPSVAVSVESFRPPDFRPAARFARLLLEALEPRRLPRGVALNVNFPGRAPADIRGVLWTRQLGSLFRDTFRVEKDERGEAGYCLVGEVNDVSRLAPGSDAWAVREGYISVTPLGIDLTCCGKLRELGERLPALEDLKRKCGGPAGGSGGKPDAGQPAR